MGSLSFTVCHDYKQKLQIKVHDEISAFVSVINKSAK